MALTLAITGHSLAQPAAEAFYSGMAEASAAAMLDEDHFVVAEDECNTLLTYAVGKSAPVGKPVDLAKFLATGDKASDLEGGARQGNVIYWISSHSLTKSGKPREWRRRFFATKVDATTSPPTVRPKGSAYAGLLEDMLAAPELRDLNLGEAAQLPPETEGGLNIEGLAAWKDEGLLIGFRGPLRGGKALAVPFKNPGAVIKGSHAKFGAPVLLDLGGRGIRSIDRVADHYLIVAGPIGDVGAFAIYQWTGQRTDAPVVLLELQPSSLAPEALLATSSPKDVMLISDDGPSQPQATCGAGSKGQQRFRALRINLP